MSGPQIPASSANARYLLVWIIAGGEDDEGREIKQTAPGIGLWVTICLFQLKRWNVDLLDLLEGETQKVCVMGGGSAYIGVLLLEAQSLKAVNSIFLPKYQHVNNLCMVFISSSYLKERASRTFSDFYQTFRSKVSYLRVTPMEKVTQNAGIQIHSWKYNSCNWPAFFVLSMIFFLSLHLDLLKMFGKSNKTSQMVMNPKMRSTH